MDGVEALHDARGTRRTQEQGKEGQNNFGRTLNATAPPHQTKSSLATPRHATPRQLARARSLARPLLHHRDCHCPCQLLHGGASTIRPPVARCHADNILLCPSYRPPSRRHAAPALRRASPRLVCGLDSPALLHRTAPSCCAPSPARCCAPSSSTLQFRIARAGAARLCRPSSVDLGHIPTSSVLTSPRPARHVAKLPRLPPTACRCRFVNPATTEPVPAAP